MKTMIIACAILLGAQFAKAQQIETLSFKSKNGGGSTKVGAYGTALGKLSYIDGKLAVFTGGYGGVLLNKKILLGAGAYSLANNIYVPGYNDNRKYNLWYTGGVFEYVHNSDKLFHWSAGTLIGGGGISTRTGHDHDQRDDVHARSAVFVAEPFVNVEMNITSYLRLVAGGTYRGVFGAGSNVGITNEKLSAPGFHLGVKAGLF
jgi:hypothetical protein